MTHLEHVSAAGIRFDTGVQYLTKRAPGLRYERLPIRKSTSAVDLHANQRAAMHPHLGQLPRAQPFEKARRAARDTPNRDIRSAAVTSRERPTRPGCPD